MRRRKPVDSGAAMADGVDYLLRRFKGMDTSAGTTLKGFGLSDASGDLMEPTIFVAAYNARDELKTRADYVCDGIADEAEINSALEDVASGGIVQLSEGDFVIASSITGGGSANYRSLIGLGMGITRIQSSANGIGGPLLVVERMKYLADLSIATTHTGYTSVVNCYQSPTDDPGLYKNVFAESTSSVISAFYVNNYVTLQNCVVGGSHIGTGIQSAGNDTIILFCRVNGGTTGITTAGPIGERTTVIGCNIYNCSSQAIYVNSDDAIIIGNRATDGITITAGSDSTRIGGNVGTISDSGTNTVYLDNVAPTAADVSPLTTKGDVWGYDTGDNRIPVGADDLVLTADSGETLGVKWAEGASGIPDGTSDGDMLYWNVTGTNTVYPYGSTPANDGIIDGLGAESADGVTVDTSQSTTYLALVASNALDPAIDITSGRSHTLSGASEWWMVECRGTAVITLTHFAVRAQAHSTGMGASSVEGRLAGTSTWVSIGSFSDLANSAWSSAMEPSSPITIDAIRVNRSTTGYHIIGSIEAWGTWYPNGVASIWGTDTAPSPLTTKGDVYTYDTAGARLAVGTDGLSLTADSGEATGLNWVAHLPLAGGTVDGTVTVDQSSTTAALPVLTLDQADVDEDFLKFIGTSDTNVDRALVDAADFTTPGTIAGWLKINIQDDQATDPITDGDYYIPFYTAPTA